MISEKEFTKVLKVMEAYDKLPKDPKEKENWINNFKSTFSIKFERTSNVWVVLGISKQKKMLLKL